MNVIQTIGVGVCITLIVTAIFSLLITNRNMERVMRFALSLFFLTVLLVPLTEVKWTELFSFATVDQVDYQDTEIKLQQSLGILTEMQLQKQAEAMLQQMKIPYEKLTVEIHNAGDSNITISRLIVWLSDANLSAPTKDCLKNYFGIVPEIKVGENDE